MTPEEIKDLVTEDGWRATGKTGEKFPPSVGGWNRKVELRKDGIMKETFVDADAWGELVDADWFPYSQ